MRHIRSVEWQNVLNKDNQENDMNYKTFLPDKLKIQKLNRPINNLVDEKIKTYCSMTTNKIRNLEVKVKEQYSKRNNLNIKLKIALYELNKKVRNKKIVICRSDKDGKLIILNFDDYNNIMIKELKIFQKLDKLNQKNITNHFEDIRKKVNDYMINLHKLNCIDNNILKHTVGIKYKNSIYSKINGTIAKNFHCTEPAYAYPLFKTHKLDKSEIINAKISDIPIRLVQSAGRITTSRVTSFLEMLFKPISIKFCKFKINEYCKDSKSYLEELNTWKNKLSQTDFNNNDIFLVAADVQGLYPNISRNLIKISLSNAIEKCTSYTKQMSKIMVDLTMFCLESVVVQNGKYFYTQTNEIATGDKNFVSIANTVIR